MKSLAIAAICVSGMASLISAAEPATASGRVTNAAGEPLDHATVLVYEARVRTGYSVYCPTCWVDCGKHATTDADGKFTIPGLNSELVFKLLAVKDGYSAAFIDKVDPSKGPAETAALKPRPAIEDPSQLVRGRVVDNHGLPVKDAVIDQEGVGFKGPNGGVVHRFGPIDWIDLMTVSNEKGEFEMAYSKPAVEMTLNVTGRGLAPKLFTLPTGPDRKTLTVSEGATITGKLVREDGKPLANVEVGLTSHSRRAGTVFPEIRIGTKEDGTFTITNVPPGRIWMAYPKMGSLVALGIGGDMVPVETKDDGQEVSIGEIRLRPTYTLRGKVVLSDNKPIPPDMHVTLGNDYDSQIVPLGQDGSFEFKGLVKGVYGIAPGVRGYMLATDNPGEVLVEKNRDNFVIRMEPAPARPR